jgi:hypothetical protein
MRRTLALPPVRFHIPFRLVNATGAMPIARRRCIPAYRVVRPAAAEALRGSHLGQGAASKREIGAMPYARGVRLGATPIGFALIGLLTGAVAAASTFLSLGPAGAPRIGGYCFGVPPIVGEHCAGVDAAVYLFPGLVFGLVFGPLLGSIRGLGIAGKLGYAVAAGLGNAVAVTLCVSVLHPLDDLLDNLTLAVALAGVAAGAAGAALLGAIVAKLDPAAASWRPVVAGAALGLLAALIVMFDEAGIFAFYMAWQGGYAAAVAHSLPREPIR